MSDGAHTYILSARYQGAGKPDAVVFSTDESGAWQTAQVSAQGPSHDFAGDHVSLAIDQGAHRLYAAWATHVPDGHGREVMVATRDPGQAWGAPTVAYADPKDVYAVDGPAAYVAAADGKAYVAFIGHGTPCPGASTGGRRLGDVLLTTFDGAGWSAPQDLTNCAPTSKSFNAPKLALDGGHLALVTSNDGEYGWDLWYTDNASGAWSPSQQLTHGRIGVIGAGGGGEYTPVDYSIAAAGGAVYIAYPRKPIGGLRAIMLATRPAGGLFTAAPAVAANCNVYNVSLAARAGRPGQIGLAYIAGSFCPTKGGHGRATPHVLTGTPAPCAKAHLPRQPGARARTPRSPPGRTRPRTTSSI